MLHDLVSLAVFLLTDGRALAVEIPLLADAAMRLAPKLRAWGLTSHRVAWLRDSLPSAIALGKALAGSQHPEVQRVLDAAAARAANLRAVK